MRIVLLVLGACLIFGAGSVIGAASSFLDKAQDVRRGVQSAQRACRMTDDVVKVSFSRTKYKNIRAHYLRAVREGWPKVMTINRDGADARRDKLLEGIPTKDGYDRDEYPAAVGRKSWRAHVALVPSSENRSHGAALGVKLRRYCDGTKFRYVFY